MMSPVLVIMGVCGSGKSTIGVLLSKQLGWPLEEADLYHSEANKLKMTAGIPLNDQDRLPWLLSLKSIIKKWIVTGSNGILTCSALKRRYRDILSGRHDAHSFHEKVLQNLTTPSHHVRSELFDIQSGQVLPDNQKQCKISLSGEDSDQPVDKAQLQLLFIYLKGSRQMLEERLRQRKGHFMSPSLLQSQLECLEEPSDDENYITIDINQTTEVIISRIIDAITTNNC